MTDIPLHRVASAFFGRPLLLAPEAGQTIADFLAQRMRAGGGRGGSERLAESFEVFEAKRTDAGVVVDTPRVSRFYGSTPLGADGRPLPFRRTPEGVAIVTIIGELVNRGAWIGASSGLVSYEGIRYQMRAAAADPLTRSIILDLSSPGGEATGAFEAAAAIREAAAVKPVVALVDGMAASGGYALASGASRIVTIPTGLVGSIGVLWVHYDFSAALEAAGVRPTILLAGRHKADGNPFEPLPERVAKDVQTKVDAFYRQFLECVAAGRGCRLSVEAARGTEARVYTGAEAVRVGLADSVGTLESVLDELSDRRRPLAASTPPATTGAASMNAPLNIASDLGAPEPRASDRDGNDVVTSPPPPPAATALPPSIAALVAARQQRVGGPSGGIVAAVKRQAAGPTGAAPPPNSAPSPPPARPSIADAARRQAAATLASRAPAKAEASSPPSRHSIADAARRLRKGEVTKIPRRV